MRRRLRAFIHPDRRGAYFAILAVTMPVLLGFAALAVDLGMVALASAQLRTAADAAALAGAKQLNDPARVAPNFDISDDLSKARTRALAVGQTNRVLGQAAILLDNPNNTAGGGDLLIGYKNLAVTTSTLDNSAASQSLFNTVQVTASRATDRGGAVPTFFGQILGNYGTPVSVTSMATVQNYAVKGFSCTPAGYTSLWPIALSKTTYDAMLSGLTTDNYTYRNGSAFGGADGVYESSMYPAGSGVGNWGTVRIGVSDNGTSTLATQIQYGVSTSQIGAASATGCSLQLNPTLVMKGNPGISLGIKSALQSRVGSVVVVPIYDPSSSGGSGSGYSYTIVAFATVAVLNTYFNGIDTGVIVQPALTNDQSAVLGSPQTSWASGGVVRLRLSQ